MNDFKTVSVVILAGGEGRRMGGKDKGLLPYHGSPLIEHVISTLPNDIAGLYISANRHLEEYRHYGPVFADDGPGYAGPLAGILATMAHIDTPYLLVLPCDTPKLPNDLLPRLYQALLNEDADIAVASSGGRQHYVVSLIKSSLRDDLRAFMASGERRVGLWQQRHRVIYVEFDQPNGEFSNINHPEALD